MLPVERCRLGRVAVELAGPSVDVLEAYVAALARAPLADQTRRTYASKVRQYLAWLDGAETDGDPLTAPTDATGPCVITAPTSKPS